MCPRTPVHLGRDTLLVQAEPAGLLSRNQGRVPGVGTVCPSRNGGSADRGQAHLPGRLPGSTTCSRLGHTHGSVPSASPSHQRRYRRQAMQTPWQQAGALMEESPVNGLDTRQLQPSTDASPMPGRTGNFHSAWLVHSRNLCAVLRSVVSGSLRPQGLWPAKLLCPWDSPGKDTGVGKHSLLQGIFLVQESNPGLLHCRQILYHRSHQGRPARF